jgi:hypothetical protein
MAGSERGSEVEDPQQVYNRDREQMERSLDSLRRSMKTEAVAHRYVVCLSHTHTHTHPHTHTHTYTLTHTHTHV